MKFPLLGRLAVMGAALLSSFSANAAILDLGTITRDTDSGLDWLDVTETRDISWNEMSIELGVGGDYEGWRYATSSDLDTLIGNFGYIPVTQNCNSGLTFCDHLVSGDSAPLEQMIRTLGDTLAAAYEESGSPIVIPSDGAGGTTGLIWYDISGFEVEIGRIWDREFTTGDLDDIVHSRSITNMYPNESSPQIGSFLVRASPIPIPATAYLFGSALAGLLVARRKNKK